MSAVRQQQSFKQSSRKQQRGLTLIDKYLLADRRNKRGKVEQGNQK